jgi:hypothetical protein
VAHQDPPLPEIQTASGTSTKGCKSELLFLDIYHAIAHMFVETGPSLTVAPGIQFIVYMSSLYYSRYGRAFSCWPAAPSSWASSTAPPPPTRCTRTNTYTQVYAFFSLSSNFG